MPVCKQQHQAWKCPAVNSLYPRITAALSTTITLVDYGCSYKCQDVNSISLYPRITAGLSTAITLVDYGWSCIASISEPVASVVDFKLHD
jgi:hypothetical protein